LVCNDSRSLFREHRWKYRCLLLPNQSVKILSHKIMQLQSSRILRGFRYRLGFAL
jgi:hypothetical protein